MRLRNIPRHINVLNVLLTAAIAVVVCIDILYYSDMDTKTALPQINTAAIAKTEEQVAYQIPPMSDFVIVGEQNVFHPDRKTPLGKAGETARPDIVLYGTLIVGDTAIAYIEDKRNPYSTPGRGKRQKAVKKGEAISGFVLKEISKDMIVLERGEEKMTVLLKDRKDRQSPMGTASANSPQTSLRPATQLIQQQAVQQSARPSVPVIMPPPRK